MLSEEFGLIGWLVPTASSSHLVMHSAITQLTGRLLCGSESSAQQQHSKTTRSTYVALSQSSAPHHIQARHCVHHHSPLCTVHQSLPDTQTASHYMYYYSAASQHYTCRGRGGTHTHTTNLTLIYCYTLADDTLGPPHCREGDQGVGGGGVW